MTRLRQGNVARCDSATFTNSSVDSALLRPISNSTLTNLTVATSRFRVSHAAQKVLTTNQTVLYKNLAVDLNSQPAISQGQASSYWLKALGPLGSVRDDILAIFQGRGIF